MSRTLEMIVWTASTLLMVAMAAHRLQALQHAPIALAALQ